MDLISNDLKSLRMPDMVQCRLSLPETGHAGTLSPHRRATTPVTNRKRPKKTELECPAHQRAGFRYQTSKAALGEVIEKMFETTKVPPKTFFKSCDGFLHLARNAAPEPFKKALETALQYRIYRYGFVQPTVKSKCEDLATHNTKNKPVMPSTHENIRGKKQL
jgi:hypothetical protein